MSTTIDQKVVEMRFDNKQFEQATSTTMSTLDKLKQKLNLTSSAKGLENIGAAANKVNMNGLGAGIEAVSSKFSAMEVVGITALANITNSAVNTGKRMVKALTIDPIKSGFNEYETQINAIQTILANTQKEGTNVKQVNAALDELNTYADKTIYNFTEMTRNIGTFTAAGVKLDTSVNAIQGIANLAAVSGSTSQQASTAMYQLSQALASGTVKLMDWNSVVNAGMGGQVFQDALKETSRLLGTGADAAIKAEGSFRESLRTGWLTSEVLTETLKKFTTSGANEYVAEYTGLSVKAVEAALKSAEAQYGEANAIDKASEALAKKTGKNKEEIKSALSFAKTAEDAATKVKTFSQLIDTTKEAIQSGWGQTWRIIFGDFEEAKNLFTPLSNAINDIVQKFSDARNKLLESALGKSFTSLSTKLDKVFSPIDKVTKGIDKISSVSKKTDKTIASLGKTVDDVILGKFGNGKERYDKLTKAGQNYYKVQNKVNKKLGDSFRYSEKQIEARDKLLKAQDKTTKSIKNSEKATTKLDKSQKDQLKSLVKLSDEQLKSKGYTEEQIAALDELRETAEKIGMPVEKFIDQMDKLNGRLLLIESFKNIGTAIGDVLEAIGKGFRMVFDPIKPEALFDAIAAFHKFTSSMTLSKDTIDKLARSLQGLFSIVKLVTTIFGGGFRIVFSIVQSVLDGMGIGILDLTATIGDAVTKIVGWFENNIVLKAIGGIVEKIPDVIDKIKEFFASLNVGENSANAFKTIMEGIGAAFEVLHSKISLSLPFVLKVVGEVLKLLGTNVGRLAEKIADLITKFRDWLKENTIFTDSVKKVASIIHKLIEVITTLVDKILSLKPVQKFIDNVTNGFKKLLGFGSDSDFNFLDGMFNALTKIENSLSDWIDTIKDSENIGIDLLRGLAKGITSGFGMVFDAVKSIATSVIELFKDIFGIHSPSVVMMSIGSFLILGLLLGMKNILPETFGFIQEIANGIIKILRDLFAGGIPKIYSTLKVVFSKIVDSFKELDVNIGSIFVAGTIVASLLLIKKALGILETLAGGIKGINGIFDAVKDLVKTSEKFVKAKALEARSEAILNFAKAIAVLTASIVVLSKLNGKDLAKAGVALLGLVGIIGLLMLISSKVKEIGTVSFAKLSILLISLSLALVIMAGAMRLIAGINPTQSVVVCLELVALILALGLVFKAFGTFVKGKSAQNIGKASKVLIKMGIAIGILALTMKLAASMTWSEVAKGSAVVGGLMLCLTISMILTRFAGSQSKLAKASLFLISMAVSIRLMIGIIKKIAEIPEGDITKGTNALIGIMSLFSVMMLLSKFAGEFAGKAGIMFISMALSISILVGVIKSIAEIPFGDLVKGTAVVAAITIVFAAVMTLANFVGTNSAKAGLLFLGMSSAIVILAFAVKMIAKIPESDVEKGQKVITKIMLLFGIIMLFSRMSGSNADKAGKMFLKMSAAILILSGAIALLSILDPADVIRGTTCISILLGMFALIMISSNMVTQSHKTILMMTIAIAALAGTIVALSFLQPSKLITATACMSVLMGLFAFIMKMTPTVNSAMSTIITLTLAIGMIAGALYLIGQLDPGNALASAISLSIVLLAINKCLQTLSFAQTITPMALIAVGSMIIAMGLIATLFKIMDHFNIEPTIQVALSLSILLIALSQACYILAGLGPTGTLAIQGALILDGVILTLGLLLVSLGGLFQYITSLEGMLDKGIVILGKIGEGIGLFVGKLIGGVAEGITSVLPNIGKSLGDFMVNAKPFFDGLNGIDPKIGETAKSLALAILALSAAELLDTINIFGGVDMSTFASQLMGLGMAMKMYSITVAGIDSEAILNSAKAAKALVEVVNALPKEGGWLQKLIGVENLDLLSTKLGAFGTAMKSYATQVVGIDCEAIKNSAAGAKALVEVLNALPKEGGLWQKITGVEDLDSLSGKLVSFGEGMKSYSQKVAGIDNEAVQASAKGAKGLAEAIDALPNDDGWWQKISGGKDISGFATSLKSIGSGMKAYSDAVAGINPEAVSASAAAANKLAETVDTVCEINTEGVSKFTSAIDKLAKTNIEGVVEAFSSAKEASKLVAAGVKMVKSVGTGITNAKATVTKAAKGVNEAAHKAISSTSGFNKAGSKLASEFSKGLKSKKEEAEKAGKSLSKEAVDGAESKGNVSSMKSAGNNLGDGLVEGIKARWDEAYNAGFILGQKAVQGEKDGQKSASPSKLTIQAGKWLGEGLVIGMQRMGRAVYRAGRDMGEESINSISRTIAGIGSLIDSDMDVQPTIAPVMDLSNVESGVGAINGLLGQTYGINAAANIRAINTSMNRRNQNGVNDDVISAINDLKKTIGTSSGNSYTINGITYDDGSNVKSAVEQLVRVAKIERRV